MKYVYLSLLISSIALLSGCATAHFVQMDYGPNRGGVVRFKTGTTDRYFQASKENALAKAHQFCAPGQAVMTRLQQADVYTYRANTLEADLHFRCE